MAVDVAHRGDDADELLAVNDYDVGWLDRDLPGMHGGRGRPPARARGTLTRILMLTAATTLSDRVHGLELGADDYLRSPSSTRSSSPGSVRSGGGPSPPVAPVLERGGIVVDSNRRVATRDGRPLDLTSKELGVLEVLLRADGRIVPAEELLGRSGT